MLFIFKMDTVNFIVRFFLSKNLSLLTAFVCWNQDEMRQLYHVAQENGIRLRMFEKLWCAPMLPPTGLGPEGAVLDLSCPRATTIMEQASTSRAFNYRYTWLLLYNTSFNRSEVDRVLNNSAILPDADVTWAAEDALVDVYRVKGDQPFMYTFLDLNRSSSFQVLNNLWSTLPTPVTRRKDLKNIYLKGSTIVTQPHYFKGWKDLTVRHVDTFPKLTYPLMMLCAEDMHFRYSLRQVDLYGEEHNGSFDGLAGLLQRSAIEVGIVSMFMRPDRLEVLHFCAETVEVRGAFIFRQPSQSSVSNVFLLPFSRGVWSACAVVFVAAAALLAALSSKLARADPTLAQLTAAEAFTFAVGTMCQQGSHMSPGMASVRVVMFSTLLASLFAFTSYSAKIVAILQMPSAAIQTIDDLTRSPMTLGVQETTYKRVYFAESNDPATQRLYKRKLLPLGERAYLSVVDGIERLRTELFAFQVEESPGYDIISKTFTEREKCGLQLIQAFKTPMVAVPIRKLSGYRELFGTRLRWQREVGLMNRERRVWLAAKTRCDAGGAGFLSVRLVDVLPAIQVLACGALLAVLLLAAEVALKRFTNTMHRESNRRRDQGFSVTKTK